MRNLTVMVLAVVTLLASPGWAQGAKPLKKCPPDSVVSGTVCMDMYEDSVWRVPDPLGANASLVKKIQQGKATEALLAAGGATRLGIPFTDDYAPCTDGGQNCTNDIFAVSLPGILPSANLTWFQAQAACKNALKRLPSNAEWQAAVIGTPDPGPDNGTTDCNTNSAGGPIATGSRANCMSVDGAFDMVGNLVEWVADWIHGSSSCSSWAVSVSPTGDWQCMDGVTTSGGPSALARGGDFSYGSNAGPLAVTTIREWASQGSIGFRCAR